MRVNIGSHDRPLSEIRKTNHASLPPCGKSLQNHIRRAYYVAKIWKKADIYNPTDRKNPLNNRWIIDDNYLKLEWFFGISIPETRTETIPKGKKIF